MGHFGFGKFGWAIFFFLLLLFIGPLVADSSGPLSLLSLFSIGIPFRILHSIGLPVGSSSDYYGFPNPNALGWILIAAINAAIYFAIAHLLSALIQNPKIRKILSITLLILGIGILALLIFSRSPTGTPQDKTTTCVSSCFAPAYATYQSCKTQCTNQTCTDTCENSRLAALTVCARTCADNTR